MRCKDLTGQKFGRLLVLERDFSKNSHHSYWKCQCDCGTIKSIRQDVLKNGSTISCGCYHKEQSSKRMIDLKIGGHNFQDLTGECFGYLTVLNKEKTKHTSDRAYSVIWKCKCKCGNIIYVDGGNLKSGHTTSCGCRKTSIGVLKMNNILKEIDINFEKEKTFPDLISDKNRYLRLDYFFPSINTAIEIDGQQHYLNTPSGYFTEEKIERIKYLDNLKDTYCKEHNIKLIRIPYTDWDKINKEYILNLLNN